MSKKMKWGLIILAGVLIAFLVRIKTEATPTSTGVKPDAEKPTVAKEEMAELFSKIHEATHTLATEEQKQAAQEMLAEIEVEIHEQKEQYDTSVQKVKTLNQKFQELLERQDAILQKSPDDAKQLAEIDASMSRYQQEILTANEELAAAYRSYANDYTETFSKKMKH